MRLTEIESILMECDEYLGLLTEWIDIRNEEIHYMNTMARSIARVVEILEHEKREVEKLENTELPF